ncbi:MAG TPA: hypothetical protein VMY42_25760 [Thermoguttaceae bacterium]|nr:hypothetical protein [Thermoguttaceae bacterium]
MNHPRADKTKIVFALVLAAYAVYAGAFIFRTSFVVDGVRHYCLFDDAMISMRYARNLAEGHGPVWNAAEDGVEGYTNPLWVAYMALLHLVPVHPSKVSLLVQITGAICLLGNLFFVRKIAQFLAGGSNWVWLAAVVLTAFYLPLNNWALQGMEVGVATLLVSAAVWMAMKCLAHDRFSTWLYLLLALGVLVRMDLLVPGAIICGVLTLADRKHRHRHWLAGLTALGTALAIQTVFRLVYYGDLLPNTYYLKMTGYPVLLRICRGVLVLTDFIWNMNWMLFLLPLVLLVLRRDKYVALLLAVFGGQLAYSAYVGGDAWEWWGGANRYVAVAMPLFFVLLCSAVNTIAERLAQVGRSPQKQNTSSFFKRPYFVTCFVVLCLISFNTLKGSGSLRQWALADTTMHVSDHQEMVRRSLVLREISHPEAKVALIWAGIIPYFTDRQMIDLSGKNDRHVARLEMHGPPPGSDRFRYFHPGHLKWDYGYSIGELQPDVVLQVAYPPGEAEAYLDGEYREVTLAGCRYYLREQSPQIRWDRVDELAE